MQKKSVLNYLSDPFKALKKPRHMAKCAMILALSALSAYLMTMYPTDYLKISITFLFVSVAAMEYGPFIGGAVAALSDIISYISKPMGAYMPLLTLTTALGGIIVGLFLYKNKTQLWRIVTARAIVVVFISTLIDTYIISSVYGTVFSALFVTRAIKNVIAFPIEVALMTAILKLVQKIDKSHID